MRSAMVRLRSSLQRLLPSSKLGDDIFTKCVLQRTEEKLLERWGYTFNVAPWVLCVWVASMLTNLLALGTSRWSPAQQLTVVFFYAVCLLVKSFPGVLHFNMSWLYHSTAMAASILFISLSDRQVPLTLQNFVAMLLLRVLAGYAHPKTWANGFWNMVYAATSIVTFALRKDPVPDSITLSLYSFTMFEATYCGVLILVAHAWEYALSTEVQREIMEKAERSERSAADALINTMCDVVVHLNNDLKIMEESPMLAAYLMHGTSRSLKGAELQQFMPSAEDRAHFVALLRAAPSTGASMGHLVHTTICDSLGTNFSVQLLIVQFEGLDRHVQYLVGLRDFQEPHVSPLWHPGQGLGDTGHEVAIPTAPGEIQLFDAPTFSGSTASGVSGHAKSRDGTPPTSTREALDPALPPQLGPRWASPIQPEGLVRPEPQTRPPSAALLAKQQSSLWLPGYRETHLRTRKQTALKAIMQCNIRVPRRRCCTFHAGCDELIRTVGWMLKDSCVLGFAPQPTGQCSQCGILQLTEFESCGEGKPCGSCIVRQTPNQVSL